MSTKPPGGNTGDSATFVHIRGWTCILVVALFGWNTCAFGQPSPPSILSPPRDKTRHEGETVIFRVLAEGSPPLNYQWQLNGTDVPGATESRLTLVNLRTNESGVYSVTISNDAGSVSCSANLTVLPPWPMGSAIVWGSTNNAPPPGNSGIIQVAAGGQFTIALRQDRSVIGWGNNLNGKTNIPPDLKTNVLAIAAGEMHGLAVKFDGTVRGWGRNVNGQATPPASLANVEAVAGGNTFSMALKDDGTVVTWGDGAPSVPAGLTNVVAIAAGDSHALALRADGTVFGWHGPSLQVDGLSQLSNIVSIAAGHGNSMALRSDGTLAVFGPNFGGENEIPLSATNIVAIATTYQRCAALRQDGAAVCWGDNTYGQSTVPTGLSNGVAISVGFAAYLDGPSGEAVVGAHTVAIQRNGVLISSQPQSTNLLAGKSVTFSVQATGVSSLSYQWQFNGIDLPYATNAALTLTNIQPIDDGNYRVLISSSDGVCPSAPAKLTVAWLRLDRLGDTAVSVLWPNPFVLQSSTNVMGPYLDLIGYSGSYTSVVSSSRERYFRLREP